MISDAKRIAIITDIQRSGNMTIEDVREELISILTEIEITGGSMVTSAYKDELKVAIETMRKYQKIKEQIDIAIDKENFAISNARLIQIREIINGNVD